MALTQISTKGIKDGTITNADISSSAAIDASKISGVMPSSGGTFSGNVSISDNAIEFDSDSSNSFKISIQGPSSLSGNTTFTLPEDGSSGQFLKTNGSGVLSFSTVDTSLVTDTSPQLGGYLDSNGHNIQMRDSDRIRVGTSFDLEIYHDSNHSYIQDTGTGNLKLLGSTVQIGKSDGSEFGCVFTSDGSVELRHDNIKRFETTSSGVTISGNIIPSDGQDVGNTSNRLGDVYVKDNKKLKIGNNPAISNDALEIYHDGTDSYLQNTTGDLYIQTTDSGDDIFLSAIDNVQINVAGKTGVVVEGDGAVDLYHNGNKKFETTSAGVELTGSMFGLTTTGDVAFNSGTTNKNILFDASQLSLEFDDGVKTTFGYDRDLQIYHDGSNSYVNNTGTGDLNIRGSIVRLQGSNGETLLRGIEDSSVELYYNNLERFKTITDGVQIVDASNTPVLRWEGASDNILGRIDCNALSSTSSEMRFYTERSGSLAEAMRLTTNGQLLLLRTSTALGAGETMSVQSRHAGSTDNNHIMSWKGDSDAISIRNHAQGDYEFVNSQQGNEMSLYDGSGGARFEYANNGNYIGISSDYTVSNRVYSRTTSSAANVHIGSNAYLRRSTSSQRYKNNIREYAGKGIEILKNIVPKTWEDHEDGTTNNGFIAEEFHNAGLTSAVLYEPYIGGEEIGIGEEKGDFYGNGTPPVTKTGEALDDEVLVVDGIDQNTLVAELVIAVKQLNSRLEALEK